MKKSSRRNAAWIERWLLGASLAALGLLLAPGCRQRVDANTLAGAHARAALDSLLTSSGPRRPATMLGDALVDVEGFRFRGHFTLELAQGGDATLELSGSTLFGGHREDVLVSLADDTLRVFDRERGRFYEAESLDALVWDATHARADWTLVVAQVLAGPARDAAVESLVYRDDGASGRTTKGPYRIVVAEAGRLERLTWPDPVADSTFDDRLEVRYAWQGEALQEITARLPARGWRVRLTQHK